MCGILAGIYKTGSQTFDRGLIETMLRPLARRGPDEQTVFQHAQAFLAHTRLSIIDLDTGTQPIFNEDRTAACILNGEIYNYRELRRELENNGHVFQSSSDTEVIIHLYEEKGADTFTLLQGMFAIVIYDIKTGRLLLARDRMGEKPVYYVDTPEFFLCASEVKSLIKHPRVSRKLDPNAVAAYLSSMYVPAPLSIFTSIRKLRPGHVMELDAGSLSIKAFWRPEICVDARLGEHDALEGIRTHLSESVRSKLLADVPLGVFLSGGIDSSAIVAMMALHAPGRINTYAVGFGSDINELPYARQVADRYGTDHTEIMIRSDLSMDLPDIVAYYDEPFADTSNIPTYLLSREARKYVKVVLTGDGGDELFSGYESYLDQKYWSHSPLLSKAIRAIDSIARSDFGGYVYPLSEDPGSYAAWAAKRAFFTDSEIRSLLKTDFIRNMPTILHLFEDAQFRITGRDPLSAAHTYDLSFYLPDDLLKKVDMASMAHGLECRAPFLDHRLVEFAMTIPPAMKLKNNVSKYLLRKAMIGLLPETILWREKHGFGAPISAWLNNELKDLLRSSLGRQARIFAYFEQEEVHKILNQFWGGSDDWKLPFKVWILLMLELWLQEYH